MIFAEGSRSRTGQMQQLLSGTARYLERPGTWVLPIGIAGTEKLFPIDAAGLHSVPITMNIGQPIEASDLRQRFRRDRRMMMDCVGGAVADLLPQEYRGVYGSPSS